MLVKLSGAGGGGVKLQTLQHRHPLRHRDQASFRRIEGSQCPSSLTYCDGERGDELPYSVCVHKFSLNFFVWLNKMASHKDFQGKMDACLEEGVQISGRTWIQACLPLSKSHWISLGAPYPAGHWKKQNQNTHTACFSCPVLYWEPGLKLQWWISPGSRKALPLWL